jgi:hypothetical protein
LTDDKSLHSPFEILSLFLYLIFQFLQICYTNIDTCFTWMLSVCKFNSFCILHIFIASVFILLIFMSNFLHVADNKLRWFWSCPSFSYKRHWSSANSSSFVGLFSCLFSYFSCSIFKGFFYVIECYFCYSIDVYVKLQRREHATLTYSCRLACTLH